MEELKELKQRMAQQRPAPWEMLPDLSLYMDQLIGYMPRQLIHYGDEEGLTSAMVNNYIKDGLLPRAEGKRYSQTHLAYLTAICAMKQVLPVKDAGLLARMEEGGDREAYEHFCRTLDATLADVSQRLDADVGEDQLPQLALELALRSYANKLACQRVIDLIRRQEEQDARDKGKKSKKEKEGEPKS